MVSGRAVGMIAVAHGYTSSSSSPCRLRPSSVSLDRHWTSPVRWEVAAEPVASTGCVHEFCHGRVRVHWWEG